MTDSKAMERLDLLDKRVEDFITRFEIQQSQVEKWRLDMNELITSSQRKIHLEIDAIEKQAQGLSTLITEAGALTFQKNCREALNAGHAHLLKLKELSNENLNRFATQKKELGTAATQSINQIKKSETMIVQKVNNLMKRMQFDEMKASAYEARDVFESATKDAVRAHKRILKKFRLKTILVNITVVIITAVTMGWYLNAELPWEIHSHAKKERLAGRALLHAWPNLTKAMQHKIAKTLHIPKRL